MKTEYDKLKKEMNDNPSYIEGLEQGRKLTKKEFLEDIEELDNVRTFNFYGELYIKYTELVNKVEKLKKKIEVKMKEEEFMVCKCCGEIDNTYSAYCIKCGRVPHSLMSKKKAVKFKKMLKERLK